MGKLVTDTVICVEGLYKIFGSDEKNALETLKGGQTKQELLSKDNHVVALDNIALDVRHGEIFVVMGLSGSGKSTLLRCINRLVEPTAGHIIVDGTDMISLAKKDLLRLRSEKLGMVFQHFALLPHRNVLDNVAFGLEVQGELRAKRYEKARDALKLVGLDKWETRMPTELSGGMQQRVGFARALVLNPSILLMDEPFSGLDPLIRKEMQKELLDLQARMHKTIVFITHDLEEAINVGDRICILRDGRIEQLGFPEEIVLSPAGEYIKAFIQDIDPLKVLPAEEVMEKDLTIFRLMEDRFYGTFEVQKDQPIFIVDEMEKYLGVCSAEEFKVLQVENPEAINKQLIKQLIQKIPPLHPRDPVRKVLEILGRPPFAVAVTDTNNQLLGAVTRDLVFSRLGRSRM